ncbi:MAG: hypothetical protein ACRDZ9_04250 [Acidimicrobiales bacterium]
MARPTTAALLVVVALVVAACGGDGRSTEALCERASSLEGSIDFDPENPDPEELEEASRDLDQMAERAPDEIAAEVVRVRDVLEELASVLRDVEEASATERADPALAQRVRALQEQSATLGQDLEKLIRFLAEECGGEGGGGGG